MKALVVGDKRRFEELKLKLPAGVTATHFDNWETAGYSGYDLIFDLNFDEAAVDFKYTAFKKGIPVIACAVKRRLSEQVVVFADDIECNLIGMNCLPGFINREVVEISLLKKDSAVDTAMQQLGWKYKIVEDRAGMVTPRIVCMIINEACYTLQEGTASMQDIDVSMKLGTNYPHGPFEWADKIGIKDVYETLDAIWQDTRDERYKICPLLKTKYLKGERFY